MKIAYVYDASTKEYLRKDGIKDTDPLPSNSTEIEPPAKQDTKTPVFQSGEWVLVDDYRRKLYYDGDNKVKIFSLGEVPDENVNPAKPFTDEERLQKSFIEKSVLVEKHYTTIDANTETLIFAGFPYDGQTFSCSVPAQLNWTGLKTYYDKAELDFPVGVPTKDNKSYSLTEAKAPAFFDGMYAFIKGHIDSGRAKKTEVDSIASSGTVQQLIDWTDDRV